MKKLFFIATLFVAGGFVSAKENSSEISKKEQVTTIENDDTSNKPNRLCGVSVTYYDSNGEPCGYDFFTSDQPTLSDCQSWQKAQISRLKMQGYVITQ